MLSRTIQHGPVSRTDVVLRGIAAVMMVITVMKAKIDKVRGRRMKISLPALGSSARAAVDATLLGLNSELVCFSWSEKASSTLPAGVSAFSAGCFAKEDCVELCVEEMSVMLLVNAGLRLNSRRTQALRTHVEMCYG